MQTGAINFAADSKNEGNWSWRSLKTSIDSSNEKITKYRAENKPIAWAAKLNV